MLYYLTQRLLEMVDGTPTGDAVSWLRVFRYITVRSGGAALTAFVLSLLLGPMIIRWLRRISFAQNYQDRAKAMGNIKEGMGDKRGTPTMGGLLILIVLSFSTLFWARLNELVVLTLLTVIVLGMVGFWDDFLKVTHQNGRGISPRAKLAAQLGIGVFVGGYIAYSPTLSRLVSDITIPFVKDPLIIGAPVLGVILTALVIAAVSNGVNITDGMDGLAIGCTVITSLVFVVLTYVAGHSVIAKYLFITYVPGAGELTVFASALVGASLGFLWFNCHPAQVFMGDTGALAIGGALGVLGVLIHQPLLTFIAGGIFTVELLSSFIQISVCKVTRSLYGQPRRVFLMAPLHYHFLKKGWVETQVVARFYIIGIVFGVIALATLKLR